MNDLHLFAIVADAWLRPARLERLLNDRRTLFLGFIATAEVVGAIAAFALIGLGLLLPIDPLASLYSAVALLVSVVMTLVIGYMAAISRSNPIGTIYILLVRQTIVLAPLCIVGACILNSPPGAGWEQHPWTIAVVSVGIGTLIGGSLTVGLSLQPMPATARNLRLTLSGGSVIIAVILFVSPIIGDIERSFVPYLLLGVASGLLRPVSLVWQSLLSLSLAMLTLVGVSATRLLPYHPVWFDELTIWPLPGLALLAAQAAGPGEAEHVLLDLAEHPTQSASARRAIAGVVRRKRYAHQLLFVLSTDSSGRYLLKSIVDQSSSAPPLVRAYVHVSSTATADAWLPAIAQARPLIAATPDAPGTQALLAFFDLADGILSAARYDRVVERVRQIPAPADVEATPFWDLVVDLQHLVQDTLPDLASDRDRALQAIAQAIPENRDGDWPGDLLAATAEHMLYLLAIEHHRGAWLL
jgi:hypothetical protein